ncbi:DUF4333 domain-containing protein [Actinopolyspora lacussalsi]|nr:DUF4333 domain-containing protein [Actinopolyspora righensis]
MNHPQPYFNPNNGTPPPAPGSPPPNQPPFDQPPPGQPQPNQAPPHQPPANQPPQGWYGPPSPQQPGLPHYPRPAGAETRYPRRKRTGMKITLITLGVLVVLGAGGITLYANTAGAERVFDPRAVEKATERILTEEYAYRNVKQVSCPAGKRVKPEASFSCTVDLGGGRVLRAPILVVDTEGNYRVRELHYPR